MGKTDPKTTIEYGKAERPKNITKEERYLVEKKKVWKLRIKLNHTRERLVSRCTKNRMVEKTCMRGRKAKDNWYRREVWSTEATAEIKAPLSVLPTMMETIKDTRDRSGKPRPDRKGSYLVRDKKRRHNCYTY